jgi:hypothetical protein
MTMLSKTLVASLLTLAALALLSPVSAEETGRLGLSGSPKATTLNLKGTDADLLDVQWRGYGNRGYYGGYRGYGYRGYGYGYRGHYRGYRGYGYGYGGDRGYGDR